MAYWDDRISKLNEEVFKDSDIYVRELRKYYDEEINQIQNKIYNHLTKLQAEAGGISLPEAKKLLNDRERKFLKRDLEDFMEKSKGVISPDIEKELNTISRRVRISRLQGMELDLKKSVAGLMNREEKKLFAHLGRTYERRYYKELYELQRITGYESVRGISQDELKIVLNKPWTSDGREFSKRIWGRGEKLTTSLKDNLIRDIIRGASPEETAKNIKKEFNASKANAIRLAYTETAAISSKATQDSYKNIGVKKYQILATLDLKTSDICRDMDGKIFDYKDYRIGITAPPFHPNCRTETVPYFDDDIQREIDNSLGRMARDPETGKSGRIKNLTYREWYSKYVVESNDKKEYENIVSILGYKVVDSVENYRDIKYNNKERWQQINREVNTIKMINRHNSFSDNFKQKVKNIYYEFRDYGHELDMHCAERFIKRLNKDEFTKEEILDVLNKDFNMKQISDDRPVKFYNNIQVIYTKDGVEVHNAIKRSEAWNYKRRLKKFE